MFTKISIATSLFLAIVHADFNPSAKLTKPALVDSLDYLKDPMMKTFHSVPHTVTQWTSGWIPEDCKKLAESEDLSAADVTAYAVKYEDVPSGASWAYNSNANIVMFEEIDNIVPRFIHETAHSLDIQGAYQQHNKTSTNSNQNWLDNYNKDPNVPDKYAQSNMFEDVAQTSVLAAFDINVPGGYDGIEPKAADVFHQYATIITYQREAGYLLVPGGTCGKRLPNSKPVQVKKSKRGVRTRDGTIMPDVSLADGLEIIEAKEFSTKEHCRRPH
ncbi:hypothetical protein ACLMJK_004675 [Lecanora helva]